MNQVARRDAALGGVIAGNPPTGRIEIVDDHSELVGRERLARQGDEGGMGELSGARRRAVRCRSARQGRYQGQDNPDAKSGRIDCSGSRGGPRAASTRPARPWHQIARTLACQSTRPPLGLRTGPRDQRIAPSSASLAWYAGRRPVLAIGEKIEGPVALRILISLLARSSPFAVFNAPPQDGLHFIDESGIARQLTTL